MKKVFENGNSYEYRAGVQSPNTTARLNILTWTVDGVTNQRVFVQDVDSKRDMDDAKGVAYSAASGKPYIMLNGVFVEGKRHESSQ